MAVPTYPQWLACAQCDALHRRVAPRPGQSARCTRCDAVLDGGHRIGIDGQLALSIAALVAFVVANAFPIVTLELGGRAVPVTLLQAVGAAWQAGERAVAALAAATAVLFPLAVVLLRLLLHAPLVAGRRPGYFALAMRALQWTTRWTMAEVFLLGALVAIVRSAGLAGVQLGAGLLAYAALAVLLTSIQAAGLRRLWQRAAQLAA